MGHDRRRAPQRLVADDGFDGSDRAWEKAERPGPCLLLLQVVLWLASALVWFRMVIRTQGEIQVWYAVLVLISLALMVANLVMLRQSKKRAATEPKMD